MYTITKILVDSESSWFGISIAFFALIWGSFYLYKAHKTFKR
jgi:hypothetical protein